MHKNYDYVFTSKVNYKNMLTKKGVLYVYRLIKDNFNFKYRVRR